MFILFGEATLQMNCDQKLTEESRDFVPPKKLLTYKVNHYTMKVFYEKHDSEWLCSSITTEEEKKKQKRNVLMEYPVSEKV